MNQKTKIAIGLGSNLREREEFLNRALKSLSEEFLEGMIHSQFYETEPWGVTNQPKFLNAVCVGISEWKPPAIVNYLKTLEVQLGRKTTVKYGPREIDLDLLAWGESIWETDGVSVPHPHLHEREFVLIPLNELWPDWIHPALKLRPMEMLGVLKNSDPEL